MKEYVKVKLLGEWGKNRDYVIWEKGNYEGIERLIREKKSDNTCKVIKYYKTEKIFPEGSILRDEDFIDNRNKKE